MASCSACRLSSSHSPVLVAEAALQEEVGQLADELPEVEVVPQLADVAVVADDGHRPQFTCFFMPPQPLQALQVDLASPARRSGATKPRSSLRPIFFWA